MDSSIKTHLSSIIVITARNHDKKHVTTCVVCDAGAVCDALTCMVCVCVCVYVCVCVCVCVCV